MNAQNFDTQRNLAMDLAGTRENIVMSKSTGTVSEYSLTSLKIVLFHISGGYLEVVNNNFSENSCSRCFMADYTNPKIASEHN